MLISAEERTDDECKRNVRVLTLKVAAMLETHSGRQAKRTICLSTMPGREGSGGTIRIFQAIIFT